MPRMLLFALTGFLAVTAAASAQTTAAPITNQASDHSQISAIVQARLQATSAHIGQAWLASGHAPSPDVVYPKITAIQLLTPTLTVGQAPAAPALRISYTTGSAGLHELQGRYLAQPSQQEMDFDYIVPSGTPPSTAGTVVIQQPTSNSVTNNTAYSVNGGGQYRGALGPYAAPGPWIIVNLFIFDNAGQSGVSNKTATLTVINTGTPDITVPTIVAGSLLTPTVSRGSPSPALVTTLTVADDLSGVYTTAVYVRPPGSFDQSLNNLAPAPVTTGVLTNALPLPANAPLGTWGITGVNICDVAGNCGAVSTPAQIKALFGTNTFQVTP